MFAEMMMSAGGGGTPTINGYSVESSSGNYTKNFDESDYVIIGLAEGGNRVLMRGESATLSVSGSYGTTLQVTFAADGKSLSVYKSSGYQYFAYFAISLD